jgi:hypothetical protein
VRSFDQLASQGLSRDAPYRFVYISTPPFISRTFGNYKEFGESWAISSMSKIQIQSLTTNTLS